LVEAFSGRRGEVFQHKGERHSFNFPFVCCLLPPKPTVTMGSTQTNSPLAMTFPLRVKGRTLCALFDSGASHSFVNTKALQEVGIAYRAGSIPVTLADGSEALTSGKAIFSFSLKPNVTTRHDFIVSNDMLEGVDIILGQDWMLPRGASIDFSLMAAQFLHNGRWVTLSQPASPMQEGLRLTWGVQRKEEGSRKEVGRRAKVNAKDAWKVCLFTVFVNNRDGRGEQGNTSDSMDANHDDIPELVPEPPPELLEEPEPEGGNSFLEEVNRKVEGKSDALRKLLQENGDLFASKLPGLPPERKVFHTITLEDGHRPPNMPYYRLAPAELQECEERVDEMLQLGLVRPSCSPYASPVLFVKKKDGTLRMVIDYRRLNKITISDRFPIPRIDDLLDKLKGAKVFTSLDLLSGYHQVRLRQEDIPKTAFKTPFGLYEFLVLPFGLTNAPATFQRLMNEVFHDFIREGFVVVYLDDVLIYSKTEEEHLRHLGRAFGRLREHALFAKLSKCNFCQTELKYLGHIIGEKGLQVDPDKVKVIEEWPDPKNAIDVRKFLGLANYFRKFIQNYSMVAAPLTQLTGKGAWKWGEEQQEAFRSLKSALLSSPILTMPDVQKPFTVVCDASDYGVGAVLLQEGKAVAFYSKKLNDAERNYCATERELLAVVYALTEWRCYLLGKPVTVITDHKCNTFLSQQVGLSSRRARWAERLQEFEIKWEWEPGRTNIADPLSRTFQEGTSVHLGATLRPRMPAIPRGSLRVPSRKRKRGTSLEPPQSHPRTAIGPSEGRHSCGATPESAGYGTLLAHLKEAYRHDPWLGVRANRRKVHLSDGFWTKEGRKYVPAIGERQEGGELVGYNMRKEILENCHDLPHVGHPGITKTYEMVCREWWWPGIYEDVKAYVEYCDSCQRVKARNQLPAGLLHPLQIPLRKWQSISMDFITGLPKTPNGHDAIWVVVDRLSKCAHFAPTTVNATAETVAQLLRTRVWMYHGYPEEIVSDRDPRFVNKFMEALYKLTGCRPALSTSYHPQSDGQTERVNRILEDYLKHYVREHEKDWESHLPEAEFAYNNGYQHSINTTPFRLTYGQDPNVPFANGHLASTGIKSADEFVRKMAGDIRKARKCLVAAQDRQAAYANRRRRDVSFKLGDYVLVDRNLFPSLRRIPNPKIADRWVGPFQIIFKGANPNCVSLDFPAGYDVNSTVNVDRLRLYRAWDAGSNIPPPPPPQIINRGASL
jgi:transposase InsO family protein